MITARNLYRTFAIAAALLAWTSVAPAADFTWTGGDGSSQDWSQSSNWLDGNVPVSATDTVLVFQNVANNGTAGTPLNQDIAEPMDIDSLQIFQGADEYHLGGGTLRLNPADPTTGILRQGLGGHTHSYIHNDIVLAADARFEIGETTLQRYLYFTGSVDLDDNTVSALGATNRYFVFENTVTGTGGFTSVENEHVGLWFKQGNTFSGGVSMTGSLTNVSIRMDADQALGTGTVTVLTRSTNPEFIATTEVTLDNEFVIGHTSNTTHTERTQIFDGVLNLNGDFVLAGALVTGRAMEMRGSGTVVTVNGVISEEDDPRGLRVTSGAGAFVVNNTATYTGATVVGRTDAAGHTPTLIVNGDITSSPTVTVHAGGTLGGSGSVSVISGSGLVSPGNSPGILTAVATDPTGGLDYAFEFTATGSPDYTDADSSINDVLRLTDATPFVSPLSGANTVNLYLGVAAIARGDTFRGGFYTDAGDFLADLEAADYVVYVLGDGNGTHLFNGDGYYTLGEIAPNLTELQVRTVYEAAAFAGGSADGYVTQFTLELPEPNSAGLLLIGTALLLRRERM